MRQIAEHWVWEQMFDKMPMGAILISAVDEPVAKVNDRFCELTESNVQTCFSSNLPKSKFYPIYRYNKYCNHLHMNKRPRSRKTHILSAITEIKSMSLSRFPC